MDNLRTDISTYHLTANPTLYESQKTNAFKFLVTGLDNLVNVATGEPIVNAADALKWSIKTFTPPSYSQQPLEIRRGNTVMKSAGTPTFNNSTISLNDFVGAKTYDVLMAWQYLSGNIKTGRNGLMKDYKKEAYLVEYTTDFAQVVRVWHLYGCWVSNLSKNDFDNSSTAQDVNISCTIEYDFAIPESPDNIE